ncbi:GNAT family N-acetyltransferase [Micromonospora sp. HNM0581]|uniref:GNAT family N-acetyltransferase n=1 Tax=Micromonospora sp. HNM0581 TaxID=2716341 RepID=UPI00321716AE
MFRHLVRPATRTDAGPLIAVLAEAFHDGPLADWLIPDPGDRRTVYYRYFRDAFYHGLDHGEVHTTGGQTAVAIWYHRREAVPARPDRPAALDRIAGAYAPKFLLLEEAIEGCHPDRPHHYLAYLAVDPTRQNQGLGTALLNHGHGRLDQLGAPAHLEASNPRNRGLYLRHGYTTGRTVGLASDGPAIWPMCRAAADVTGERSRLPRPGRY